MNLSTPSEKEKIKIYEAFLHDLNLAAMCGDNERIRKLVSNADKWSYAHRVGNGQLSDEEQEEIINKNFWKLLD